MIFEKAEKDCHKIFEVPLREPETFKTNSQDLWDCHETFKRPKNLCRPFEKLQNLYKLFEKPQNLYKLIEKQEKLYKLFEKPQNLYKVFKKLEKPLQTL